MIMGMRTICETLASVSTAAIPILFNGSPESVMFAAALPPVLTKAFEAIGQDFINLISSKREKQRLAISYFSSWNMIKHNIDNKQDFRSDDLLNEGSDFEDILEATFKEAIADCEAKKSKYYGNFIGNLLFAPQIDYSYSFTIQRIIRNLSYKELCIIRYFKDNDVIKLQNFDSFSNDGQNIEKNELAFYFKNLLSLGVIHKAKPMNLQYELDNMKLSPLGNDICTLLNLQEIDRTEIDLIGTVITKYQ